MAAKRKKARRAKNPKRSHRRRARRTANPAPRRRRRHARRSNPPRRRRHTRRSNPRRRRHTAHAHRSNPRRRRHHRRRNPGGPFGDAAIGVGVATAAFLATQAIGYFVTTDQVADGQRNRGIIGGVLAAGGLFLMRKHPTIGLALTAGSLLGAFSGWLTLKMLALLPAKSQGTSGYQQMSAVYNNNMAGYQQQLGGYVPQMSAVYNNNLAGIGAVYNNNMAGMGEFVPPAPWSVPTPF